MTSSRDDGERRKRPASVARTCPICGKPSEERFRPFCSKRCADVDLGHWLGGRYAIPAEDEPPADSSGGEADAVDGEDG